MQNTNEDHYLVEAANNIINLQPGFTPVRGQVGTGVTITGSNFSRVTTVQFNGVNANFRIASDVSITTTVPANATDGSIKVTNRGGSATSSSNFDVYEYDI